VITDVVAPSIDGTSTPNGEPADDFFSSWDKPTIKRPSNPPSRTQTPPVVSRTESPFLNPSTNGSGPARPKSPLIESESSQAPTASRTISSSSIRKSTASGAPRKTNVLAGKKTQKLGAKRVGGAEGLDFEAAEKKAKEEAERIEKLGYDPDAEAATASAAKSASATDKNKIASPTPLRASQAGYGSSTSKERSESEVDRLGMGLGKLGFGQTGGAKPAAPAPQKMGFGAVGGNRAAPEGSFSP
jgi:ADP-ribosylation factor GTPase-activating protein 2/3